MKTRFHYIKSLSVCLFGTLMFLSCGENSQKTDEFTSAKEKADESFRNALRDNLSDVATTNEIAEQELKRAEEKERLQNKYAWMDGEWHLSSSIKDPYVGRIDMNLTFKIDASDHSIRFTDRGSGEGYSGTYEIDEDNNAITCKGNRIQFDPTKKAFYEQFNGRRDYYKKESGSRYNSGGESGYSSTQNPAPYGYDGDGVPYASRDHKNLDKALDKFEKARQGYINATYSRNPMDLMYYHQCMKNEIGNCLRYARNIGDRDIIEEMKRLDRMVDNLEY